jgi:hypothetical protein
MSRVVTQKITLYDMNDVMNNTDLKVKVLQQNAEINFDSAWYESVYEGLKESFEQYGYGDIKINFSGFNSQGDGASFTGTIDALKWLDKISSEKGHEEVYKKYVRLHKLMKSGLIYDYIGTIKRDRNTHYVHWNTTSIYFRFGCNHSPNKAPNHFYNNIHDLLEKLGDDIHNHHNMLNKNAYTQLEKYYDDLISEESVLATLKANEYEFSEDGKIINLK